ncbi:hypothetical protein BpHYR1_031630 [Brachionus plicatilis]|uniref:Uncharacterized protein n=1 Tax=Brachionus plicatilis TaxID=10195 RepID=A0A3M7S4H7_BRAPC|nr:hypothetical protein BpHYR1_031630 [Brachionus plicatilis]
MNRQMKLMINDKIVCYRHYLDNSIYFLFYKLNKIRTCFLNEFLISFLEPAFNYLVFSNQEMSKRHKTLIFKNGIIFLSLKVENFYWIKNISQTMKQDAPNNVASKYKFLISAE